MSGPITGRADPTADSESFLVTGGAGGLGLAVCDQLLDRGARVVVYDLQAPPARLGDHPGLHWVRGDIRDRHALPRTAKRYDVDVIVHLAAMLSQPLSADPATGVDVNCLGMVNVLETARLLSARKVIWSSSLGVFSGLPPGSVVPDDSPYAPPNVYAATKILGEVVAAHYARAFGVDTVGLRLPLMVTFASQGVAGDIATELVANPVHGLPGVVPAGDDAPSWLAVEDAARAVVLCAENETAPGTAYNVGGDVRPMREAIQIMKTAVPGADLTAAPGLLGFGHAIVTDRIETDLGFRVRWRLESQLDALIDQARERHPARPDATFA